MPARRLAIRLLAAAAGAALTGAAVFAVQLGLDNDPGWGRGRTALLLLGLGMIAWAASERQREAAAIAVRRRAGLAWARLESLPPVEAAAAAGSRFASALEPLRPRTPAAWLVVLVPVSILTYNWIFTAGRMTDWPAGSRYFHRLAEGFRAGQLSLLEAPSPELLASPNPYFYKDRGDIPVLWDALFFEGQYYLYWGPVPGLVVAGLQPFAAERIRDSFLVFIFLLGYLGFAAALMRSVWRRFDWLPRDMFPGGLLSLALAAPVVWLFTRPHVYEAAIAGGQFFLVGGLFFAFSALAAERPSALRLALAGGFWALAANTRVNLAPAIALLGLLVIVFIWRTTSGRLAPSGRTIRLGLSFGLPLLAGAALLMGYNHARFGSPFDFGYNYLITGPTIPEDPSRKYSLEYAVPNLYQYLVRPPALQETFPYIVIPWIKNDMWPDRIRLPPDYFYTEPVAGLPWTVPVTGLAALAGLRWGWLRLNGVPVPARRGSEEDRILLRWLAACLGGILVTTLPVLLVFTQNTYRYLADLTPAAVLLSVLLFAEFRSRRGGIEGALWRIGWALAAVATPAAGLLIAVTGYAHAFEELNPGLYQALVGFFP